MSEEAVTFLTKIGKLSISTFTDGNTPWCWYVFGKMIVIVLSKKISQSKMNNLVLPWQKKKKKEKEKKKEFGLIIIWTVLEHF